MRTLKKNRPARQIRALRLVLLSMDEEDIRDIMRVLADFAEQLRELNSRHENMGRTEDNGFRFGMTTAFEIAQSALWDALEGTPNDTIYTFEKDLAEHMKWTLEHRVKR